MNISPSNISGTCFNKCNYSFQYMKSHSTATNYGNYISLNYESVTSHPVEYNNLKYKVDSIQINSPSLHKFNGQSANGEIIISHSSDNTGKILNVCVPFSTNGISTKGSDILSNIIQSVGKYAPSIGENTSQGIQEFSLNDFVPMKPFFSYETDNTDFVVFGIQTAFYINNDNLNSLQSLLSQTTSPYPSGPNLFFNEKGPVPLGYTGENEIYIDCQPTNSSEENVTIESSKSETQFDLTNIFQNPIFQFILYCLIFFLILFGIYYGLHYLSGSNGSNGSNNKIKNIFSKNASKS